MGKKQIRGAQGRGTKISNRRSQKMSPMQPARQSIKQTDDTVPYLQNHRLEGLH